MGLPFSIFCCSEVARVAAGGFQVLPQCIPVLSGMPGDRSQQHPAKPSPVRTRTKTLNSKDLDHSAQTGTTDAMKAAPKSPSLYWTCLHGKIRRELKSSGAYMYVCMYVCMYACMYEMDGSINHRYACMSVDLFGQFEHVVYQVDSR